MRRFLAPKIVSTAILFLTLALLGVNAWPKSLSRLYSGEAFLAFYCAGDVASHGEDPYRVKPLIDCEHNKINGLPAGIVEPAPLPGFALAPFELIARIPYFSAIIAWLGLLLVSLAIATWALLRLTSHSWITITAALLPNAAWLSIYYGETVPIVISALCLSAYAIRKERLVLASVAAAATTIEPHIGVPVCLALFIFLPGCRIALTVSGIALFFVSILTLGVPQNIEYFVATLPAQAHSEITANDQYSLTWALHAFGVGDALALRLGSLSYLVMVTLGILAAKKLARTMASPELIVLIPAATVLLAGVYIHDIQMAVAIPAALIVADRTARYRTIAFIAVSLIAVPWGVIGGFDITGKLSLLAVVAIAFESRQTDSIARRALNAFAIAIIFFILNHGLAAFEGAHTATVYRPVTVPSSAPASLNWEQYVRGVEQKPNLNLVGRKVAVWLGFCLLFVAAFSSRSPRSASIELLAET